MKPTVDGKYLCALCMPISVPAVPTPSSTPDDRQDRRAATMQNLHLAQLAAQARRGQTATASQKDQFTLVKDPRISADFCLGGRKGEAKKQSIVGTFNFTFDIDDNIEGAYNLTLAVSCFRLTHTPSLLPDVVIPRFLDSLAPSWGARHENKLEA